jgi:hypothetical protein
VVAGRDAGRSSAGVEELAIGNVVAAGGHRLLLLTRPTRGRSGLEGDGFQPSRGAGRDRIGTGRIAGHRRTARSI